MEVQVQVNELQQRVLQLSLVMHISIRVRCIEQQRFGSSNND